MLSASLLGRRAWWGGWGMLRRLLDLPAWAQAMGQGLDSDDPAPPVQPRPGFSAIDAFLPAVYKLWQPLHQHFQVLGYVDDVNLVRFKLC